MDRWMSNIQKTKTPLLLIPVTSKFLSTESSDSSLGGHEHRGVVVFGGKGWWCANRATPLR